jgi:hypothetical protein
MSGTLQASDIRFAGTDDRLLRIAQGYGIALDGLDPRTLPDAVASAIEAQGLRNNADVRGVVADLLRASVALVAPPPSVALPRRQRRDRLAAALVAECFKRRTSYGALKQAIAHVARQERVTPQRIEDWIKETPEVRSLVTALRADAAPKRSEPQRGPKVRRGPRHRHYRD